MSGYKFENRCFLITGGAGYIGSHIVKQLGQTNANIIVYDNLSTGHADAVLYGSLIVGDLADKKTLRKLFETHQFDAVLHFAGSISVPESIEQPLSYYANNTLNSHTLLSHCIEFNVKHFIFSSTAAVYGIPKQGICDETNPLNPINPYGQSKLMTEQMLKDTAQASNLNYVALRYFNVAGADLETRIGQATPKATHLIKVCCEAACGKRPNVSIFGTDYDTPDGTCVRDYIHVDDLANAHLLALQHLLEGGNSTTLNCGYNHGISVREIITKVQNLTGINFPIIEAKRRAGDPPQLIANAKKIQKEFGWVPQHQDLETIIKTAYEFEKKLSLQDPQTHHLNQ